MRACDMLFRGPCRWDFIQKFAPLLSPPKPITSKYLHIDDVKWGFCWWTVREDTKDMPVFQHVEVSTSTVPRCLGEMVKVNGLHRPAEFLGLSVAQLVLAMREAEQMDVDQYAQQHPEFGCPRQRLVVEVTGADLHGIVSSPSVTFSHTTQIGLAAGDVCIWAATELPPTVLSDWETNSHATYMQRLGLPVIS